jgi:uncharacterized membrane protein SpoIIM required for sporulation
MLAEDFIAQKRPAWERLTTLLNRARGGLNTLSAEDLQTLGRLYREATSDLAVARRDFPNHPVSDYLNGLVARAHGVVYRERSTRLRGIVTFFTHTFPRSFRATWTYTLASFLMFFIPALVSFILSYRDPDTATLLMPALQDVITDIETGREWWKQINEEGPALGSAAIMTNNIQVTFAAFAGGVTFGLYTLYILTLNGIMLGSVAGAAQRFDFADNLWGFVAAHGTIELSVIFIAGGAGLQLGWSILRPGLLSRRAALVIAARRAVLILAGCAPLLVIAGTIEGFISPSDILPLWFKLFVSFGSGVLLYSYLILSGRSEPEKIVSPAGDKVKG